jgi:hypothetical protein
MRLLCFRFVTTITLLAAGLDSDIKLWDTRNLSQPTCTYYGHVPSSARRLKKIHHPTFYIPRQQASRKDPLVDQCFILTGGEGSHALSMFRYDPNSSSNDIANRSSVFSRGTLFDDCGDVGCIAVHGEMVAASVDGGDILLLAPTGRSASKSTAIFHPEKDTSM